jgi:hypothetical protein
MNLAAIDIGIAAEDIFEEYCFDYNSADLYDMDCSLDGIPND